MYIVTSEARPNCPPTQRIGKHSFSWTQWQSSHFIKFFGFTIYHTWAQVLFCQGPHSGWNKRGFQGILIVIIGLSLTSTLCITPIAAAAAKSLQSCPTLCDPIDGSRPGSPVPGILRARTLEWVAISFSNAWKRKVKVKLLGHVWLFTTPWTIAYQAPPFMGFARQEYWSGVPLPSPISPIEWV